MSIKKIFLAIFFMALHISLLAQTTQKGVVKEYNDKKQKTPLANVEIVVSNAGSNVSGKDGKFTLTFRTLMPGDKVDVRKIEKTGYEIFNIDALNAWRIANDGSEFVIVLCKSSKFKALKDKYNAIASKSYAEQMSAEQAKLQQLLNEGAIKKEDFEKKLARLKVYYDEQLENLDNYIDRFARIDLNEISAEEQKIIEMVQNGKITEAINAYEGLQLEQKYTRAVDNIAIASAAIKQLEKVKKKNVEAKYEALAAVTRMNDLRRMQGGTDNVAKIGETFRKLVQSDSTNVYLLKEYADYLKDQRRFNESLKYYDLALDVETHADNKAAFLIAKATAYIEMRDVENAEFCLKQGVRILDSLQTLGHNKVNDLNLINCYNSLGNLSSIKNDAEKALEYYLLALSAIERFEDKTIGLKRKEYCCCNNIGIQYNTILHQYGKSIDIIKRGLDIANEVYSVTEDPEDLKAIHSSQISLATAYAKIRNEEKAIEYNKEAEASLLMLLQKNHQAHLPQAAIFYNQIGVFWMDRKKYKNAESSFAKGYEYASECFKQQPTLTYKLYMLCMKSSLGDVIALQKGRKSEGYDLMRSTIKEMEFLCPKAPAVLNTYYSIFLQQYAETLVFNEDFDEVPSCVNKILELTPDEANAYDILGGMQIKKGEYQQALESWRKINEMNPDFFSTNIDSTLHNVLLERGMIEK